MISQDSLKQMLDISRANLRLSKSEIYSLKQSMKLAYQQMDELYNSEEYRQCRKKYKKIRKELEEKYPNSLLYRDDS